MAWSYSGDPSTSSCDAVRFLIGDTVTSDPLLQNEEIEYMIAQHSNIYLAAAFCCDAIEASFSRLADTEMGELSVKASQRAIAYAKLAAKLRKSAMGASKPHASSVYTAEKEAIADDTSIVQGTFKKGMHDYRGE